MRSLARPRSRKPRLAGWSIGNVVCWYLAVVVLLSLTAQFYFHLWWVDGAASLVIVGLLVVEGVQAIRGTKVTA